MQTPKGDTHSGQESTQLLQSAAGTFPAQAVPTMLPCSSEDRRRLVEELIKAQDKSLLAQVSLLCHLLQQYLTLPRKARAALQEAQERYKPESLKCQ